MKYLLLCLIGCLAFTQLFAQKSAFKKGDIVFNTAIGLRSTKYQGISAKVLVVPLSISGEAGIVRNVLEKGTIGVGGFIGYSSNEYTDYEYKDIMVGAKGYYHYPFLPKLDTYAGLIIGYDFNSYKYIGSGSNIVTPLKSGIFYSWFLGGKYYFMEKIAGMLEIGYGITYLNIGIALKL